MNCLLPRPYANADSLPPSLVAAPRADTVLPEKGRLIGTKLLSSRDEEVLLKNGIEITHYLGEGYFSNVWRGIYRTTAAITTAGTYLYSPKNSPLRSGLIHQFFVLLLLIVLQTLESNGGGNGSVDVAVKIPKRKRIEKKEVALMG